MVITLEELVRRYNKEDGEFLYEMIQNMEYEIDDPCIDNHRVALKDDEDELRQYEEIKSEGCCGFYDDEVEAPTGNVYLIGCNFGH